MLIVTGVVVARVTMSKITATAYGAAIRAIVECCNKANGVVDLVHNLKGIVVDWSSAQIIGVKLALVRQENSCYVVARYTRMHLI